MDSLDDSYLLTGYEPNAYDLKETYVKAYTESLTTPQFSKQGFLEDVEYDDTALEDMLREAHRVHVHHSQQEGLSVGQSSSSFMSERTVRSVGERTGRPVRPTSETHRLELCWTDRKSKFSANVRRKLRNTNSRLIMTEEVYENYLKLLNLNDEKLITLARAEEVQQRDQQLLHERLLQQNSELREAHFKSLKEVSEFHLRHHCKTKISRGPGHYFGTYWKERYRICKMKLIV